MTDLKEIIADWRKNGTPGPWSFSRASKSLEIGPISDLNDQSFGMVLPIADVFGENVKVDATLIAAAPDMADRIEALEAENARLRTIRKLAHDLVTRFVEGPSEDANTFGEWDALVDAFNERDNT